MVVASAFVATNRKGESITSGLPVTQPQFHEAPVKRLWQVRFDE